MAVTVKSVLDNIEGIILLIVFFTILGGGLLAMFLTGVNDSVNALAGTGWDTIFTIVTPLVLFGILVWVLRMTLSQGRGKR